MGRSRPGHGRVDCSEENIDATRKCYRSGCDNIAHVSHSVRPNTTRNPTWSDIQYRFRLIRLLIAVRAFATSSDTLRRGSIRPNVTTRTAVAFQPVSHASAMSRYLAVSTGSIRPTRT